MVAPRTAWKALLQAAGFSDGIYCTVGLSSTVFRMTDVCCADAIDVVLARDPTFLEQYYRGFTALRLTTGVGRNTPADKLWEFDPIKRVWRLYATKVQARAFHTATTVSASRYHLHC